MTNRYIYTLHLESRMSAASGAEKGNHIAVHTVLPGSVVRGAFAAAWWTKQASEPQADAAFAALFDHALRVGHAVPDGAVLRGSSTWLCKYQQQPGCREVSIDDAILAATGRVAKHTCPVCGHPTEQRPGWHRGHLTPVRMTATQLLPSERAADGKLYSRDAIPVTDEVGAAITYSGELDAPGSDSLDWLRDAVIQIGAKRSLSLGLARVTVEQAAYESVISSPLTVVRLASPAVLLDAFGSPSLDESTLVDELRRVTDDPVEIVEHDGRPGSWIRSEAVMGWHMRSALPKPAEWAMATGTTAVIRGLTAAGAEKLRAGIGYRTLEGFGAVMVLDPQAWPDPPESAGRVAAAAFLKSLDSRRRSQGRAAAHQGLTALLNTLRRGKDTSAVISAHMGMPATGRMLVMEKTALRRLYELKSEAHIEDALELLRK